MAEGMSEGERLKVAVVGVGLIGEQHAEAWASHPRTRVALVCDLDEERARAAAARLGCDWTTSVDDVAASDVEICSVVTPDFAHRAPAVRLAEAGKHLLIEKPLATTSDDGRAIVQAARASGVRATVSLGNRWMPQIQQARESVQAGEIGEPTMFYARLSDTIDVPTRMLAWAGRSGPQWFLFSHTMDYLRWILGQEAIEVYAVGQKKILAARGIDAFCQAARELEAAGVRAICTSCGFLALHQRTLAASVQVPVFSSSLLQVPLALAALGPARAVGVVTFKAAALTPAHFAEVGVPSLDRVRVLGLERAPAFYQPIAEDHDRLDPSAAERQIVTLVAAWIRDHPDIGALVLECTNLPPYAGAIRRATGLPTWDVVTLVRWARASMGGGKESGRRRS